MAKPVRVHWLVLAVLVAGGYALGSELAFSWFGADGTNASFFPAAGVTLAALVLVPRRQWPIVLAAAGLAELFLDLSHDIALDATLGYVGANLTQPVVGAALLLAAVPRVDLGRTRHLAAFVAFAVVAGAAVGGALGATTYVFVDGGEGWARFAAEWWVGDGLGILVVGGAILAQQATTSAHLTRRRAVEGALLAVAAALSAIALFRLQWFALVYVPVAILVVLAFRVGTRGVALTGALVAFVAAEATAEGHTFWESIDISTSTALLYMQLGIAILIVSTLALAAEIAQRERMAGALARVESDRVAALERASLYEAEQAARERAGLLERHAAHVAAAASATEIAAATIAELESAGIEVAVLGLVRGDVVETIAASGIQESTRTRYASFALTETSILTDAIRLGAAVVLDGDEYERRYPSFAHVRRETGMSSVIAVPLRGGRRGDVLGALAVSSRAASRFDGEWGQLVAAVAEQTALALERAQLQVEADRAAADAALLARLGEELERLTTTVGRAEQLARTLSDELGAMACISILGDDATLELVARAEAAGSPEVDAGTLTRIASTALASDRPVQEGLPGLRVHAMTLRARARALGTLTLAVRPDDTRVDSVLLQRVATRGALALDNALLYEQERDVSHSLQLSLLGGQPAPGRGTDVASAYLPATKALAVGGDWYDVLDLPRGTRAFVVGDVVGHGLEAAKAMGQLRGAVRALAPIGTPADLLRNLDVFVESVPETALSTLAYVELDPESGRIRYACAGHPPPLVVTPTGTTRFLWDGRSTPLGSSYGSVRLEGEDVLAYDETVLLYTDGLVERRTVSLDAMLDALLSAASAAAGSSPARIVDGVLSALLEDALEDDVCMLAVRLVSADHFTRTIVAAPRDVASLRHALDAWLRDLDVGDERRRDLVLAVAEAAANSAEHAYSFDGVGTIRVDVRRELDGSLSASVSDEGTWRPPVANGDRGRGMPIIRALTEDVSFASDARGTVVHMRLPVEVGITT